MQVLIETSSPEKLTSDALAFLSFEAVDSKEKTADQLTTAHNLGPDAEMAGQEALPGEWLTELRASGEFTGKLYEISILHRPANVSAKRLVVIGAGKREKFGPVEARRIGGVLVRALKPKGVRTIAVALGSSLAEFAEPVLEGAILGDWEPDKYKTDPKKKEKQVDSFIIVVPGGDEQSLQGVLARAEVVGTAQNATRDLVNEPANRLTPELLSHEAQQMAAKYGLSVDVLDQDAMAKLGMGSLLGVAQGSTNPPFLVVLKYRPPVNHSSDHLALVGKGVTFDTGGISIKPADGMEKMKYDMAGAAAVVGAMRAIAQLKPAIPVTGYIPTVENMINGNAQRPGDIVTAMSGKTIEVLNTDAEGRLILADAITYAKQNGATHIVDAATLTGAIGIALGHIHMGSFTNDAPFLERFMQAAKSAGEKTWQLPMDDEYKDYLKSSFADLPNIGGRYGGSITAAWFLREFADPTPWVHLDIASTAWLDESKAWLSKGPTGVAVRSFIQLATNWNS